MIEVKWSGGYPNLCSGEWTLIIDGVDHSDTIPFQGEPANTLGEYQRWRFAANYSEEFYRVESGKDAKEWCVEHSEWLEAIAPEKDWQEIFEAFRAQDWRYCSCGGCI